MKIILYEFLPLILCLFLLFYLYWWVAPTSP